VKRTIDFEFIKVFEVYFYLLIDLLFNVKGAVFLLS